MAYLDLNGNIVVQKGYFGLMGNTRILVYYPIISSRSIKAYGVKK